MSGSVIAAEARGAAGRPVSSRAKAAASAREGSGMRVVLNGARWGGPLLHRVAAARNGDAGGAALQAGHCRRGFLRGP